MPLLINADVTQGRFKSSQLFQIRIIFFWDKRPDLQFYHECADSSSSWIPFGTFTSVRNHLWISTTASGRLQSVSIDVRSPTYITLMILDTAQLWNCVFIPAQHVYRSRDQERRSADQRRFLLDRYLFFSLCLGFSVSRHELSCTFFKERVLWKVRTLCDWDKNHHLIWSLSFEFCACHAVVGVTTCCFFSSEAKFPQQRSHLTFSWWIFLVSSLRSIMTSCLVKWSSDPQQLNDKKMITSQTQTRSSFSDNGAELVP